MEVGVELGLAPDELHPPAAQRVRLIHDRQVVSRRHHVPVTGLRADAV